MDPEPNCCSSTAGLVLACVERRQRTRHLGVARLSIWSHSLALVQNARNGLLPQGHRGPRHRRLPVRGRQGQRCARAHEKGPRKKRRGAAPGAVSALPGPPVGEGPEEHQAGAADAAREQGARLCVGSGAWIERAWGWQLHSTSADEACAHERAFTTQCDRSFKPHRCFTVQEPSGLCRQVRGTKVGRESKLRQLPAGMLDGCDTNGPTAATHLPAQHPALWPATRTARSPPPGPRAFGKDLRRSLFDSDPTCQICGGQIIDVEDAEVDHILPWTAGGATSEDNAQLAHRTCNRSKSASVAPGASDVTVSTAAASAAAAAAADAAAAEAEAEAASPSAVPAAAAAAAPAVVAAALAESSPASTGGAMGPAAAARAGASEGAAEPADAAAADIMPAAEPPVAAAGEAPQPDEAPPGTAAAVGQEVGTASVSTEQQVGGAAPGSPAP